jgi:hypothetical protein
MSGINTTFVDDTRKQLIEPAQLLNGGKLNSMAL